MDSLSVLNNVVYTKKNLKLYARRAEVRDVDRLTQIINWAYRGKDGANPWTTESHLVEGRRITEPLLEKELSSDQNVKCIFLVETMPEEEGQQREIVGTIKIERDNATETSAMIGMFGVDPSMQSNGVGGVLFKLAEEYVKTMWHADRAVLHVISTRDELLAWYNAMGYKATGLLIPFNNTVKNDRPKLDNLCFSELVKPLL
ncbi:hypothetical protein SAMD00019534_002310 [Acytostelium subglobosum LB1]|uniref:hypothetical protein n=1 Tax=Acytostelium subglobosum LB1 TaxID=1410327 RepID=UPI0006447C3E|nr:hypothetical protein SAMD00019534_002310 [Acytostelium subglobosum LB1]GAM17056.1 hypothetical protein SAMD00019534_002310 [Acytostelium subglobosum LB1]|eukprot:XP_012759118.1 hypothetical protein SAMD00019534_002310 [Acytostelium subglobosum LB1]